MILFSSVYLASASNHCTDILATEPFEYTCMDIIASIDTCDEIKDLTGHNCDGCGCDTSSSSSSSSTTSILDSTTTFVGTTTTRKLTTDYCDTSQQPRGYSCNEIIDFNNNCDEIYNSLNIDCTSCGCFSSSTTSGTESTTTQRFDTTTTHQFTSTTRPITTTSDETTTKCTKILETIQTFSYNCLDIVASIDTCVEIVELTGFDCYGCGCDESTTRTSTSSSSSSSTSSSSTTYQITTTTLPKTSLAKYVYDVGQCDEVIHCTITSTWDCEQGASYLGHPDTIANRLDKPSVVSGCSTNNANNIRYNVNQNDVVHSSDNGKQVICELCQEDQPYAFYIGECDENYYCTITSQGICEEAALFLSHPDTTANVIDKTNAVAGCSTNNGGGLRLNTNFLSTHVHDSSNDKKVLCEKC